MFSHEIKYSISLIKKAERSLAQMSQQIASLPPEAFGTQLQTLGFEVMDVMEGKLRRLHDNHCRLLKKDELQS